MPHDTKLQQLCWNEGHHFYATISQSPKRVTHYDEGAELPSDVNTYFAVADYVSEAGGRTQANVETISAFWADIDTQISHAKATYQDKEQALAALVEFSSKVSLPAPSAIVDSGGGLQVYWALNEMLTPAQWTPIAKRLLALFQLHGLDVDPARTADCASIMRLPGTYNQNTTPPSLCEIIHLGDTVDLASIEAVLPPLLPAFDDSNFGVPRQPEVPGDAEQIASKCAVLAEIRDSKGDVEEPLWYAGLQLLKHCSNFEHYAHDWSSGHPEYSAPETDLRLQRLDGYGPTLCERFKALRPDACAGCPFAGKISSPIQLGRALDETPVAPPEPDKAEAVTIPQALEPYYHVGHQGIWTKGDEDATAMICFVPVYIESVNDSSGNGALAILLWRTPQGSWRRGEFPLALLASLTEFREWFYSHAITNFQEKPMVRYLRDYATAKITESDPTPICTRFGWKSDTEFFLGSKMFTKDSIEEVKVATSIPNVMLRSLTPVADDATTWTEASKVLSNPRYWRHAVATLVSLASPILHWAEVQGAVLSLAGESGTGKTVSSRFALSVWGNPDGLQLSPQGTMNSKGEVFRICRHLPVLVDDLGVSHAGVASELVYMAANGRAKESLDRNRVLRGQDEWQLALILTTNSPLMDLSDRFLGDAERRRIIELDVNEALTREDAMKLVNASKTGGAVAKAYISELLRRGRTEVRAMFNHYVDELLASHNIPDVQRFGIWMFAAACVAGHIASEIGLIEFDWPKVMSSAAETLTTQSANQETPVQRIEGLLQRYMNENSGKFTAKYPNRWVIDDIKGEIAGCIIMGRWAVAIPASKLNDYVVSHRIPTSSLKIWAAAQNIERLKTLLATKGGREYCYLVPMNEEQIKTMQQQYRGVEGA